MKGHRKVILCSAGHMVVKVGVASRWVFFIGVSMGRKGGVFIIGPPFLGLILSVVFSLPCSPLSVFVTFIFFCRSTVFCSSLLLLPSYIC